MSYKLLRQGGKILRNYIPTVNSFNPLNYTPIAWYDSSDVSTITKDISNKVSQWNDKSGFDYHLTQSVDISKPLYSVVNGIVFDGVNDYLLKSFGVTINQPITIFTVFKYTSTPTNNGRVVYDGYVSNLRQLLYLNEAANELRFYNGGIQPGYSFSPPYSEIISTAVFNGSNSSLYENNNIKLLNKNLGNNGLNGIVVGAGFDFSAAMQGNIKEIIIYNSALTSDQITNINNYLNQKYNIY